MTSPKPITLDNNIAALIAELRRLHEWGKSWQATLFADTVGKAADVLAALSAGPTEAMKEAGYGCVPTWPDDAPPIQIVWRAMYDAALAERGKGAECQRNWMVDALTALSASQSGQHQSDSGDDNAGAKKAAMANNVLASRAACEDSPVSDPTPAPATPESGIVAEIDAFWRMYPQSDVVPRAIVQRASDEIVWLSALNENWRKFSLKIGDESRERIASLEAEVARLKRECAGALAIVEREGNRNDALNEAKRELARAKPVIAAAREFLASAHGTIDYMDNARKLRESLRAYDKERE